MRRPAFFISLVTLLAPLGGCYISSTPLITPAEAVFPYQTITYAEASDAPMTLVRKGDAYVIVGDKDNDTDFLFAPVSGPYYVVQAHIKSDQSDDGYLYGFLKVEFAALTAEAYAMVADASDIGPSLPACTDSNPSDGICLVDLKPYIAHAMAMATDAARAPDALYHLDLR